MKKLEEEHRRSALPSPSELFEDAGRSGSKNWPPPRLSLADALASSEATRSGEAPSTGSGSWEAPLSNLERLQAGSGDATAGWPPPPSAVPLPPVEAPAREVEEKAPSRRKKRKFKWQQGAVALVVGLVFGALMSYSTKKGGEPTASPIASASGAPEALTPSPSPSPEGVASPTPMASATADSSATPAATPSPDMTGSPTPSSSPLALGTPLETPTPSASPQPTASLSPTPDASGTPASPLPVATETPSATSTPAPATATPTPSPAVKPVACTVKISTKPRDVNFKIYLVGLRRYEFGGVGMVEVTDVKPGNYKLKVVAPGFQSFEKRLEIKADTSISVPLVAADTEPEPNRSSYQPPPPPRPYTPPRYQNPPPRTGGGHHELKVNL